MDFTVDDVIEATGGRLAAGSKEARVTGFSIDSRTVKRGDLFFALAGPNFDAHAFVPEVAGKGAAAVVVERDVAGLVPEGVAVILVDKSLDALGYMAAFIRSVASIPVVAVSGTTGKTTTREMIASILSRSRRVLKTQGNKNNLIGLPLTLFRLDRADEAAVVELGISEQWEMSLLVEIAAPDVALITNIGAGHLESLGDRKGVAKAKAALFMNPSPRCVRVVNLDDELVKKTFEETLLGRDITSVTFGFDKGADVFIASYSVLEGLGGIEVEYVVKGAPVTVRLKSPALCNVINGAAAIAAALPLDASLSDIKEGLEGFGPVDGRLTVTRAEEVTVIDDSYNANPDSMEAALKTLSFAKGRKVAVIGEMLELGETAACAHATVGSRAAELGVDLLMPVGAMAAEVANGALLSGLAPDSVLSFSGKEEAIEALEGLLLPGDTVLVKASRGMGFESVAEAVKRGRVKKSRTL